MRGRRERCAGGRASRHPGGPDRRRAAGQVRTPGPARPPGGPHHAPAARGLAAGVRAGGPGGADPRSRARPDRLGITMAEALHSMARGGGVVRTGGNPMIERGALLRDLQRELAVLEADVRRRTEELSEYDADLRGEYRQAFELRRTAATYGEWRDRQVTQAAVAWLLGCVFARFCEDNGLVAPVWLAGPPERRAEAVDAHTAYFHAHPERNDRDWLLEAFGPLRGVPATAGIFHGPHP